MALLGAEVIVDHLDDTGTAINADRSTGPQAGDPLAVPGHRSDRRDAADQEHADEEQDRAEPTAPQDPHPRHAVPDLAGGGAQVHLSPHHRPAAGRQDRPSSRRLETAGKGTTPPAGAAQQRPRYLLRRRARPWGTPTSPASRPATPRCGHYALACCSSSRRHRQVARLWRK